MEDYFLNLLDLGSYFAQNIILAIEDLLFKEVERLSQYSGVSFFGACGRHLCSLYQSCCCNCSTFSYPSEAGSSVLESDGRSTGQNVYVSTCRTSNLVGVEHARYLIHEGCLFQLNTVKLGCRLALNFLRSALNYVRCIPKQVQGFLCRLRRTLQGSSEDIGWLQKTDRLPPVVDGTLRFMELLQNIRSGEHCLPDSFIYLLIPGLFSNLSPLYFLNTKRFFSRMGLACYIAKIHSEASVERNARELKLYIEELYWGSGKRLMLLGHSKGGLDAAAALSIYWSELRDKVAGLAVIQCPYAGSPIASDILRQGQIADKEARKVMEFIVCKLIKGDIRALDDLTYEKRKDFILKHRLPSEQIPVISFHTEAGASPGVLATASHIAHAELPWLPLPRFCSEADKIDSALKVPVVIPLSAAMAVCSLHLQLRYGEKSDGLVTRRDAEVPGSVVVRLNRKLDHAWMVYSLKSFRDNVEADASEMCEALLTMLVEIGRIKHGYKD